MERTFIRERYVYHATADGESASVGPTSRDAPIARLIDANGDGDYEDSEDRVNFFLTNRRGDVVAVITRGSNHDLYGFAQDHGRMECRVLYSAYGVPRGCHLLDMDRDGNVGPSDEAEDLLALVEAEDRYGQLDPRWRLLSMVLCADNYPCADPPPMSNVDYFDEHYPEVDRDILGELSDISGMPLYAGYWWDHRLKLFHVRHRVYDPSAGRFLQRDPIGYAGGSNLYMYGMNSPFRHVDPLGLDAWSWGGGILRDFGMDGAGEFVDDLYDGVAELINPVSEEGRQAQTAVVAAAATAAAAVVIVSTGGTALVAAGLPIAAKVLTVGAGIAGGVYAADATYAAATGSYAFTGEAVSPEQRRLIAWELVGGFAGVKVGTKIASGINSQVSSFNENFHQQLARSSTYERWMSRTEYDVVVSTSSLPGGRRWIYATTDSYANPTAAQRGLALPGGPRDAVVRFHDIQGRFGGPTPVDPQFGQPGSGTEVRAIGTSNVPIEILPGTRCFSQ